MTLERTDEYYVLLEQLLTVMTDPDQPELSAINEALTGLCKLLRISKGVTEFYESVRHEQAGKGEVFVCYDDGSKSHVAICRRIITPSSTIAKCTVYMTDGAPDLTEEERRRVTLIMNTVLSSLSRSRLQTIVERLTFYDDVGYRNLRAFMRYLKKLDSKSGLGGHTAVHFNLRHFSLINQEIGRSGGNRVMRGYYELLDSFIGERGIICRMGGDQFVAIFESSLTETVLKILKGAPVLYDTELGKRILISAYTGVLEMPEDFTIERPGDIMDRILSASQAARSGGLDTVVYYNEDTAAAKERTMRIQQLFPAALRSEEFQVYYQPKIDVETGDLVGAEALCRWIRDGRIVPPIDFIPVLEQSTDICQLDFYMLDHVCRDIRRWLDEGRTAVRVSVNLSRKHMMDVDLLEHILEIIDRNNVPHQYIEIELTETTTDVEFRDLKRVVSGLQKMGIFTSVDDFGMGYSSLKLIREIPWDVLKVDKSFLPMDGDDDRSSRSIMFKYVIAMAKELGLECIAEGVETKNQVDILRGNQCMVAQGYFFDKPLCLADFEKRLEVHHYSMNGTPDHNTNLKSVR